MPMVHWGLTREKRLTQSMQRTEHMPLIIGMQHTYRKHLTSRKQLTHVHAPHLMYATHILYATYHV